MQDYDFYTMQEIQPNPSSRVSWVQTVGVSAEQNFEQCEV